MFIRSSLCFALSVLSLSIGAALAGEPASSAPANAVAGLSSPRGTPQTPTIDPKALERAELKFRHALDVVDQIKPLAQAEGITGDNWRFALVGNLMKGSEADFADVAYARSYTDAVSASLEVARDGNSARRAETQGTSTASGTSVAADLGSPTTDLVYVPITPCRVLDTRKGGSASLIPANSVRTYRFLSGVNVGSDSCDVDGQVPGYKGTAAFAANVTVDETGLGGFSPGSYLKIYPYGVASIPTTSFLNFGPGQTIANAGVLSVDPISGAFSVISNAPMHLIVDTYGVFIAPQATALSCSTLTASRIISANTNHDFDTTATCPAGKTAVAPYCWNGGQAGVYSGGGGVNGAGGAWCQWINTNSSDVTVYDGSVCCGVPGR